MCFFNRCKKHNDTYKLDKYINFIDNDWECPICLNTLESGKYIIFPFNCCHSYCYDCIKYYKLLENSKLRCYICDSINKKMKIPFKKIYRGLLHDKNIFIVY